VAFVASIVADAISGATFDFGTNQSIIDDRMVSVPALSPELVRLSIALARAISAGTGNWAMYPPEHPSIEASVTRIVDALASR